MLDQCCSIARLAGLAAAAVDAPAKYTADVERTTGAMRWLAQLYNDHRVLYALFSVGLLLVTGLALGALIEAALSALGRGTEQLDQAE